MSLVPLRAIPVVLALVGASAALTFIEFSGGDHQPLGADAAAAATADRPTVAFVQPKSGARVVGAIKVIARVSKAPAISRVEFRVDGKLRWTDRRRPYVMNGDRGRLATSSLPAGRHRLTITAVARNGSRRSADRRITVGRRGGRAAAPPATAGGLASSLRLIQATGNTLTIGWNAVAGATEYGVVIDGRRIAATTGTSYTITGLSCGIRHRVLVDSVSAAGVRSAKAVLDTATAACPPPSVFLSPSGNDGGPCSAGAPCATLARGYQASSPGQVVQLAAGAYPGGRIDPDAPKTAADSRVVLAPAPNAAVTVSGELFIDAQHIELRDMALPEGWQTLARAADVVVRNADSRHFFMDASQGVSIIGGRVGPGVDYHPIIQSGSTTPPRNILIDGVWFHDWTVSNSAVHTECLQIGAGDGITIRNSRFTNCHATGNVHVSHWGPSPRTRNVTIENNFFSDAVDGYYSLQANAVENLLIRNNTSTQAMAVFPYAGISSVRVIANLAPMAAWACTSGVQYRSNVSFGPGAGRCHSSDAVVGNPGFVNEGALDLHVGSGSPALNRGSAAEGSEADIDGEPRPLSGGPDAGADER